MICTIISDGSELDRNCRNEKEKPYPEIKGRLRETIWKLFCEGYTEFYVNCEYGIPLWTAEIITALKLYNDIVLNIVVPFEEQCHHPTTSLFVFLIYFAGIGFLSFHTIFMGFEPSQLTKSAKPKKVYGEAPSLSFLYSRTNKSSISPVALCFI